MKRLKTVLLIFSILVFLSGSTWAAHFGMLSYPYYLQTIQAGEDLLIDLGIGELSRDQDLTHFIVELSFDESYLEFVSHTIYQDFYWGVNTDPKYQDLSQGNYMTDRVILDVKLLTDNLGWQSDSIILLARLKFKARDVVGDHSTSINYLAGEFTDNYINDISLTDSPDFPRSKSVTIKGSPPPVPEPSTVFLFGAGLLGLACTGRKKRMKK